MKLLPTGIKELSAGKQRKAGILNFVGQKHWLALGRNEIKPSACDEVALEGKELSRNGIEATEVINQPAGKMLGG
jgi:hypothetical protein